MLHASQADSVTSVWKQYHPKDHLTAALQTSGQKHKIFDAGCGTGQLTTEILKSIPEGAVEIFGGDYSPEMLSIAKGKNIYNDLKVVNLKEELPYAAESFDSVISSGVFLQGHCGPECIPNII